MTLRKLLEDVANGETDIEQAIRDIQSQQRMMYSNKITAEQLERLKVQLETYVNEDFFIDLDTFEEITSAQLRDLIEKHLSEEFMNGVKELGYDIDRKMGVKFALHDVSLEYISKMNELELEDVNGKLLVKAKIHDVTPIEIAAFLEAGVNGSLKQYIKMKIHGVTPEYTLKLQELGYEELAANELVKLRIHNVTIEYIEDMIKLGLKPSLNEFRKMAIHDVSASFVEELKNKGFEDIGISELVKSRIHGLEGEHITFYQSLFDSITLREMTKLSIHGIDKRYIDEIIESGVTDLSPKDLIKLANHGVRGNWITEFENLGFSNLTIREYIKAKSHGLSPDFLQEIREAGMDDLSFSEAIQFRIHGVYPSYIRKVNEIGYTPNPQQLIQLQIHGVTFAELAHGIVEKLELRQVIRSSIHH